MDDGYPVTKPAVKPHNCLVGKRNLRYQHNGLPALLYRSCNQFHIDFRLSASGYSEDQRHSALFFLPDGIRNTLLLWIQTDRIIFLFSLM